MEKKQYSELKKVQKTHWWFQGKEHITLSFYDWYCGKNKTDKILDAGCGMGLMLEALRSKGEVFGMDIEDDAVAYCRELFPKPYAETHIRRGILPNEIPFDTLFDTVIALDVIEHIEDDARALTAFHTILKDDGTLLLTVPANKKMWSGNDVLNHHFRRYERSELEEKIIAAGFEIVRLTYFNSKLYPIAVAVRQIKNLLGIVSSDVAMNANDNIVNKILMRIFKSEAKYLSNQDYHFGVSLLCIAKKTMRVESA